MRKIYSLFSKGCLMAFLVLPTVFTACSDDDEPASHPDAPKIVDLGMPADTIIALGEGFTIAPVLNTQEGVTYSWKLNGQPVEAESNCHFAATETGEFNIVYRASNESGAVEQEITIQVRKYYGGFYVLNEGRFGAEPANICYYDVKSKEWQPQVFQANNPGESLGATGTVGVIEGNKMYLVSKDSPYLVEIDLINFKKTSAIQGAGILGNNGQASSFCAVNETTGVLTSTTGAYKVSLNPLTTLGGLLEGSNGPAKDICKVKDYVFIINGNNISVYKASDLSFVKNLFEEELTDDITGFAQTIDGTLWAATASEFLKIDPTALTLEKVEIPGEHRVNIIFGSYSPSGLCASTTENALYFIQEQGWNPKEAYKYNVANKEVSLLIAAPDDSYFFYGSGLKVNPKNGNVYATFNLSYTNTNKIFVIDGKTGNKIDEEGIDYPYWFPSMLIF